jgi:hypothetical protein
VTDPAALASLPFWFVVGMWARVWLEDTLAHRHARPAHRKRPRGAR